MTARNLGPGSTPSKIWRLGNELLREDQAIALIAWDERRYTVDRLPEWARNRMPDGEIYPVQFLDDLDWLAHTKFAVTMNGRLDKRVRECREEPTWPSRPDLRGLPLAEQARFAPNIRWAGWSKELGAQSDSRLRDAEEERALRGMTPEQQLEYLTRKDGA